MILLDSSSTFTNTQSYMKKTVLFSIMLGFGVASCGGVTATESPPNSAYEIHLEKKNCTAADLAVDVRHVSYELAATTDQIATFTRATTAYESCPYDYGPAKESAIVRDTREVKFDLLYVDFMGFRYRPNANTAGELQTTTMLNYWDMTQWTTRSSRLA